MAATWVDAEAASNMRPCQGIDPSKLKIENQQGNDNNKCDTYAFQRKICVILFFFDESLLACGAQCTLRFLIE